MSVAGRIAQLGKETAVYGISGTISRFIGLFLVPVYTRVFTPADYGLASLIGSATALLSTFVVLGMDSASSRWYYDSEESDIEKKKTVISSWFWCQGSASMIGAFVLILLSDTLSANFLSSPGQGKLLVLAALGVPLWTFTKVLGNWFRYQRRAWSTMTYSIANSLVSIGLTILFVLVWQMGLLGLYWAQLLAAILMAIVGGYLLRSWLSLRYFSWKVLKEMFVFGLPLVPAGLAIWVTNSSDRLILNLYCDKSQIGLYSLGSSIASAVALVTGAFQMAWSPFAFSIVKDPNSGEIYAKVWSLYSLAGCAICTCLVLFTPHILRVFATPTYYPAESTVAYLAFSYLAMGALQLGALGCNLAKKSSPVAVCFFLGAGLSIGLNFLLVPALGRDGAAIASCLSYSVAAAYIFFASQRLFYIPFRHRVTWISIVYAGAAIALGHFFIPSVGVVPFAVRLGLCVLFLPLAIALGIVQMRQLKRVLTFARQGLKLVQGYF